MAKLCAMMLANVTQLAKPIRFTRDTQHLIAVFLNYFVLSHKQVKEN
jgi:hypothetical protein